MIFLNLLPPERRAAKRSLRKLKATRRLALTLAAAAVIAASVVLSGERVLALRADRLSDEAATAQARLPADEVRELGAAIKGINQKTKLLADLTPQDLGWGRLTADLLNSVPPGITLTRLAVSQVDRSITLDGVAATRGDLLALKDAMLKSKFMESFDTPLSDLTRRDNIDFPAVSSHVPTETIAKYRRP